MGPKLNQKNRIKSSESEGPIPREPTFSADEPIGKAGHKIMMVLLDEISIQETALRAADVTSVHETRKGIRKLRTALRLFSPYFNKGVLKSYQKQFRKFMRRLSRSRDLAVFLMKMETYMNKEDIDRVAYEPLWLYWQTVATVADNKVRTTLATGKYRSLLADFEDFNQTADKYMRSWQPFTPIIVGHIAPIMIYEALAAVRVWDNRIQGASLESLHKLRIQCKELRYTLEFFEPVLGPHAGQKIDLVKEMLQCLGNLNDARVALEMLASITDEELIPPANLYMASIGGDIERAREEIIWLWNNFEHSNWREELAKEVAVL